MRILLFCGALLSSFFFSACAPHPGASVDATQAREAVVEITQALRTAQDHHQAGEPRQAKRSWSTAHHTFNTKLVNGVEYHASSSRALQLSYMLGSLRNEMEQPKGDTDQALASLTNELEEVVRQIPEVPSSR